MWITQIVSHSKIYEVTSFNIESEKVSLSKEYPCSCRSCLQFDFQNCSNVEEEISDDLNDLDVFDDEKAEGHRE